MPSRPRIDPGNPVALAAWLAQVRTLAEELHGLTFDATARKTLRRYSRTFLREQARRTFHKLGVLLMAADPAGAATPDMPPAAAAPSQT